MSMIIIIILLNIFICTYMHSILGWKKRQHVNGSFHVSMETPLKVSVVYTQFFFFDKLIENYN